MDICFHYSWVIYLGVELLGPLVSLSLTFEELPDCFSKWLHHFPFPPATYEGSSFSTSLSRLVMFRCELVSHYGFDLHFLDD